MQKKQNLILNIESSTTVCSASISGGARILAFRESMEERSHASILTVFIDEVMKETDKMFGDLSAVAVSRGPGSYTGLRIGVSVAKGICYGADLPLIAIDTLWLMAWKLIKMAGVTFQENSDLKETDMNISGNTAKSLSLLREADKDNLLLCPMIDARRMEVFTALFDTAGNLVKDTSAEIIDESSFGELNGKKILFFGDGADKCKDVLSHRKAVFIPGIYPSAKYMAELSANSFLESRFEDTAYFEPFYLKDFIATTPKNKIS